MKTKAENNGYVYMYNWITFEIIWNNKTLEVGDPPRERDSKIERGELPIVFFSGFLSLA